MKLAIVFDSPYEGWDHQDHEEQMRYETSRACKREAEPEYQVARTLSDRGHEVFLLGAHSNPTTVTEFLSTQPVDMAFNLSEGFAAEDNLDFLLPAMLEANGQPYTGASPQALMVTRNKAMTKKILGHHHINVPDFRVFRPGEKVPKKLELRFPVIVKPLTADGSQGISKASVVRDTASLKARVDFIHQRHGDAAICEEYIDGRELYVSVLGNGKRARTLPVIEARFDTNSNRPEDRIATRANKWNYDAKKGEKPKSKIKQVFARRLSSVAEQRIEEACMTAYRALWLRDYARFDLRLDAEDRVWVLEANANPYISKGHEAANSAKKAGMDYGTFLESIIEAAARRYKDKG